LNWLERAYGERLVYPTWLKVNPEQATSGPQRFADLLRKVGLALLGTLNENSFQIEYAVVKMHGTVPVSGQRQGRYYIVTSNIEENNK